MSECAWCGSTREATTTRSQTMSWSSSKTKGAGNSKRRMRESAEFTVPFPCCAVCDQFLTLYERETHWILWVVKWVLPLFVPFYSFISHFDFSLRKMRFEEGVMIPVFTLWLMIIIHLGIRFINWLFAFEFRLTYLKIRSRVAELPTGMIGRLEYNKGRNSILAADLGREGGFGSGRYRIGLYRDARVPLPIKGRRNTVLASSHGPILAPFSFDRSKGPWIFIPYFLCLYLIPIPILIASTYASIEEYSYARSAYEDDVQMVALSETLLQRRQAGQPMTTAECEAEASSDFTCWNVSCKPADGAEPRLSFEAVTIGQTPYYCPPVAALEANLQEARRRQESTEKYSPPFPKLVSGLVTGFFLGLLQLALFVEAVQNLIAFVRRRKTDASNANVDGCMGGCMMFVLGLGMVGSLLAAVLFIAGW